MPSGPPRAHPQVGTRAGGQLLQRAGFADPVIDSAAALRYRSLDRLVQDLREQGLSNCLARTGAPLGKAALARARDAFAAAADADGRVTETFEILTLSGWAAGARRSFDRACVRLRTISTLSRLITASPPFRGGVGVEASLSSLQRRLRRRQSRDRHAVGAGRDVIEADLFAEGDRGRIAAMLAADAELDVRAGLAATLGGKLDQLADAFDIEADERIARVDALVDIRVEEARGVVAAHAQRGLRQVVGAEREERASSAISAISAARGSSIMVPTR
jgi:hypothetical protein